MGKTSNTANDKLAAWADLKRVVNFGYYSKWIHSTPTLFFKLINKLSVQVHSKKTQIANELNHGYWRAQLRK